MTRGGEMVATAVSCRRIGYSAVAPACRFESCPRDQFTVWQYARALLVIGILIFAAFLE